MRPKLALTIAEISSIVSASFDVKSSHFVIKCASSLGSKMQNSVSFYNGGHSYLDDLQHTTVSACFIKKEHSDLLPASVIRLICENPYLAITQVVHQMYGAGEEVPQSFLEIATLKKTEIKYQNISDRSHISSGALIGNNVTIMAGAYIGSNVEIRDDAVIHANSSLEHCTVGKNCVIRSGARIGSCGFGFVPNFKNGEHMAIPQIARVILEESVDIGANSCVDRGFLTDTTIGAHTKIDNMVHIGHGVTIGRSCFFAGGTVVAGSCRIGNFCMIGGQSAIANNVVLPDFTEVLGMSGIAKGPSEKGKKIIGSPAIDHITWKRIQAYLLNAVKKHK
jgi:UDP-3-O-[3-hydroxymyristoyl] glucosamine N-acyltransferase